MTNDPAALEKTVRSLVNRLAAGDYEGVIAACTASRLTGADLRDAISPYGRTLVEPPRNAGPVLDAIAVESTKSPTWSVRVPLWTKAEGQSDLTLELTLIERNGHWDVELDDLHVL